MIDREKLKKHALSDDDLDKVMGGVDTYKNVDDIPVYGEVGSEFYYNNQLYEYTSNCLTIGHTGYRIYKSSTTGAIMLIRDPTLDVKD